MKKFVIYDEATGEILRTGTAPTDAVIALQAGAGEAATEHLGADFVDDACVEIDVSGGEPSFTPRAGFSGDMPTGMLTRLD